MRGNFGNLHLVYRGRGNLVNMRAMLLANAERAMVRRSWLSDRAIERSTQCCRVAELILVTTDSGLAASVRASDAVQPNRSIEHKGKVLKQFGAQILSVHHHLQCIDPDNRLWDSISACVNRAYAYGS
jgi:hypothetical protein